MTNDYPAWSGLDPGRPTWLSHEQKQTFVFEPAEDQHQLLSTESTKSSNAANLGISTITDQLYKPASMEKILTGLINTSFNDIEEPNAKNIINKFRNLYKFIIKLLT